MGLISLFLLLLLVKKIIFLVLLRLMFCFLLLIVCLVFSFNLQHSVICSFMTICRPYSQNQIVTLNCVAVVVKRLMAASACLMSADHVDG